MGIIKYRADIDGLRALAILPVVFFHVGFGFRGGFIGVDVFFVISGFIITAIIFKELSQDCFSILEFYSRRIRRILPALSFVLICAITVSWWLLLPSELFRLGGELISTSTFLANIKYYLISSYWDPVSEDFVLLHTWFIAVQVQFYIFIPLLLVVLYNWFRNKIIFCLVILSLSSFVLCVYLSIKQPRFAFYMLPTRAWELLLGSLLYMLISKEKRFIPSSVENPLGVIGILMILISCFHLSRETTFPGYAALLPTLGAVFVIYSNSYTLTLSGKVLAWRPLKFVGLISYSLYLWHWPVIVFVRAYRYPSVPFKFDRLAVILASIALATISWRFVERPFRGSSNKSRKLRIILCGVSALCFFALSGLGIRKAKGFACRFDGIYRNVASSFRGDPHRKFNTKNIPMNGGLQFNTSEARSPLVVVIGDSHGMMYGPLLEDLSNQYDVPVSFFTQGGKLGIFADNDKSMSRWNLSYEQKLKHDVILKQFIVDWKPKVVFLICRWDNVGLHSFDTQRIKSCYETFEWLSQHCNHLVVVLQPPTLFSSRDRTDKYVFNRARKNGGLMPLMREPEKAKLRREAAHNWIRELDIVNLEVIDPSVYFQDANSVRYHDHGKLYYLDNDHLSVLGTEKIRPLFENFFIELKKLHE